MTTRRDLLRGAATSEIHSEDAELLELGRQFDAIAERLTAEYARLRELDKLYGERKPEIPAALRVQEGDAALRLRGPFAYDNTVGSEIRNLGFIERLRNERMMREVRVPIYPERHPKFPQPIPEGEPIGKFMRDHHILVKAEPWPEAQVRADEIVAAFDRHEAECNALRQVLGLEGGEEECERIEGALEPITDAIAARPATTLDGFRVKARAALWWHGNCVHELIEEGIQGHSATVLAASIIRDLLASEAA